MLFQEFQKAYSSVVTFVVTLEISGPKVFAIYDENVVEGPEHQTDRIQACRHRADVEVSL